MNAAGITVLGRMHRQMMIELPGMGQMDQPMTAAGSPA